MADDLKKMYRAIEGDHFPPRVEVSFVDAEGRQTLVYEKTGWEIDGEVRGLRYGENPGQEAALYKLVNGNLVLGKARSIAPGRHLASDADLLQSGKHPGKINITDADNALNILRYFTEEPCAVIVKHNNPCGVALDSTLERAYHRAYMADRVAAFGGCIAFNRPIDKATAEAVSSQYVEVVVAPDFEEGAYPLLTRRKNLRVIQIPGIARLQSYVGEQVVDFKSLMDGGLVLQWSFAPKTLKREDFLPAETTHQGKTYSIRRKPTDRELDDLLFGWLVEAGVTSNSVLYVKDKATVGIGAGEQDRVGVAEIARDKAYRKLADRYCFEEYGVAYNDMADLEKRSALDARVAGEKGGLIGAAMVSDAFFPFRDGVDVGIREGVSSVVQPGGAMNDHVVIEVCNEAGVAMVFTGQRSFKH
jgi:phosphoribosylaminoimidazolecarboxamide formyltransferase/IMP cyclohydrolase